MNKLTMSTTDKKIIILLICCIIVSVLFINVNAYNEDTCIPIAINTPSALSNDTDVVVCCSIEDNCAINKDSTTISDKEIYDTPNDLLDDTAQIEDTTNKSKYFIMVVKNTNNNEEQDEDEKDKKIYTYSEEDVIAIAKTLYGECRGTKYKTIQSGVAWCILNRYDTGKYGKTITDVVSRRKGNDFLGYDKDNPVRKELYDLAKDVLDRWVREKNGEKNVGRTLPKEYKYFRDFYDGNKNIFFKTWNKAPTLKQLKKVTEIWRWEWGNPYGETPYIKY